MTAGGDVLDQNKKILTRWWRRREGIGKRLNALQLKRDVSLGFPQAMKKSRFWLKSRRNSSLLPLSCLKPPRTFQIWLHCRTVKLQVFIINSQRYAETSGGGENPGKCCDFTCKNLPQRSEVRGFSRKSSLCCGKSNLFKGPLLITAAVRRHTSAAFPEQKLIFSNKKKKVCEDLRDFNFLFDLNWRKTAKTKSFFVLTLTAATKSREKHWKASHFPRSVELWEIAVSTPVFSFSFAFNVNGPDFELSS